MLIPSINRPHRQAIATAALVLFTISPTAYVALTAWRINRPAHVREVEAELARELGLRVAIQAVRHPRPGEDVLSGVVVRQEEPRGQGSVEVARAASVRVRRGRGQVALEAEGLRIRGEGPRQAMGQIAALLQRAGGSAAARVSLSAPFCGIELGPADHADSPRYQFRDVVGVLQASRAAATLTVSYRVPADGTSTRCELSLNRDRQGEAVRTVLAFKTMEGLPLPAKVLDPFFDSNAWLGGSARVEGTLTLCQAGASDWEAEFQGLLVDVDLGALVSRRFPDHRLSGLARVSVNRARWADRPGSQGFGWVEAEGTITTGPGTIGMALVRALKSEMKFQLSSQLDGREHDLPFHGLGLSFKMTPDGELKIDGGLGSEYQPGAVLVDARHYIPLASAPEGAANVRGLIRALFPTPNTDPTVLVPDTPESRVLRFLPAPRTASRRTELMSN